MNNNKYMVLINDTKGAENMDIETATILIEALFRRYYDDHTMMVSIKEMERTCNAES